MNWTVMLAVLLAGQPWPQMPPVPAFRAGDVVVTSARSSCLIDPPPPPDYVTELHRRDAPDVSTVTTATISAMTYWSAQRGIFIARGVPTNETEIDFLGSNGSFIPLVSATTLGHRLVSALTPLGNDLLAAVYSGADVQIWRIDRTGSIVDQIPLPAVSTYIHSMDVAADGCTLFYANQTPRIARFDLCTRHSLPDLAVQYASSVRVLPDGGLLVGSGANLVRLDAQGNVIAQFAVTKGSEFIADITLDENPGVVRVLTTLGCSNYGAAHVVPVSVATGSMINGPETTFRSDGQLIAVQGEWHASVNKPSSRRRTTR